MDPSAQCLVVIYLGYWNSINYLWWDVESTLELNYEKSNTPMGLSGPHSKLIYLFGTNYEGRIGSRFTFVHKGVFGNFATLHRDM